MAGGRAWSRQLLLLAGCLVLAGCGGGGATSRAAPAVTATASSTTAPTTVTSTTVVPATTSTTAAAPQPLQWAPCTAAGLTAYQCAVLMVPIDPADPGRGSIGMAVDRRRATGERMGSLLVNPGGPGASGVAALPYYAGLLGKDLLARFDLVGFDPPGVGRSAGVTCLDDTALAAYLHLDPDPPDAAGLATLVAGARSFAAGCEARSGTVLPFVSTAVAAHDMDLLRASLGDAQLTYLGVSYGTFLGASYAEQYPTRIRAMVLDGALDPALDAVTLADQQSAALDGAFRRFAAACVAASQCEWKPQTPAAADLAALVQRARTAPLPAAGTDRRVGPAEVLYGTAAGLYSPSSWATLGQALHAADRGDGTGLLRLFDGYTGRNPDGTYTDSEEANAAVNCLDDPVPTAATIEGDVPAAEAMAPLFGATNLLSDLACAVWPVPPTRTPHAVVAPGAPPIVVVGSTGDPVTPYAWAVHLAGSLQQGVLLTRVGDGHSAYPYSACVDAEVDSYLLTLTPPPAGTRCSSGSATAPVAPGT